MKVPRAVWLGVAMMLPVSSASADEHPASRIRCESEVEGRQHCPADTSKGVALVETTGTTPCLLGRNWGYDDDGIWVADGCSGEFTVGGQPADAPRFGSYTPSGGFKVANTTWGDLNFRVYSYVRYLNQTALDETYTDSFGQTKEIDRRQDVQLNKVNLHFFGWLFDPRLRYLAYVWTSNTSQGLGAQVVVGGNFTYEFSDHFTLGFGISGLPGTRSVEGNFPFWLTTDNRLIADEYFRTGYTTGIWARGAITDKLDYFVMLGNNLSQLGIDAGQLDASLDTWSGVVIWMPTTGEFGRGFGDFEHHEELATRFALHYSFSNEDRQSQPGTEDIENVQLRISDGNIIFTPELFGRGIAITDATYQMMAFDFGFKLRGFSVEGEYFVRRLDGFEGAGVEDLPFQRLDDHGFQLQTSAMVVPETVQVYLSGSKIFGEYGNPWDARLGVSWFPWHNQVARWNTEVLYLDQSPVGALSLPFTVGGTGPVFYTNFEVNF